MRKNRVQQLEKAMKHRLRPNNGCVVINYEDNPLPQEEIDRLILEGIEIINVVYTNA